jgi:glycosyltransferase involved in cell wall biosynthesis
MRGLIDAGVSLTWQPFACKSTLSGAKFFPVTDKSVGDVEFDCVCNADINYDTVIMHLVPEFYPQFINVEREKDNKILGMTVYESNCLPKTLPGLLNQLDGVIVSCEWVKEVFVRGGVKVPVYTLPHILDVPASPEPISKLETNIRDQFIFYTINQWTPRKALEQLVEVFTDTFNANDPVILVIKTTKHDYVRCHGLWPKSKTALKKILKGKRSCPKVLLIDDDLDTTQIAALHRKGDCYVSLTHSEGWGLGAFDAAGAGKPVIMTAFGGQLEFLPAEFSYLVPYSLVKVPEHRHYKPGSDNDTWALADSKTASELMREVFENRQKAVETGEKLSEYVWENFNSQTVTRKLISILETS